MRGAFKTLQAINPAKNIGAYIQTSLSILKDFSKQCLSTQGTVLHCHLMKMGISYDNHVAVKLLIMYLKCRKTFEADQIIKDFNGFNLVGHNCLISANVDWGKLDEARKLFDEMPQRNEVSWTAMISGFFKYGRVEEAMWFFYRNPFEDVYKWTAGISGLVQNGLTAKAMKLFLEMLKAGVLPNDITFTSVVKACADLGDFGLGRSVLGLVVKSGFEDNVSVSNSFVTFHLRLGEKDMAMRIFDQMGERDVVSWTAILDMYVEKGDLREARRIFDEMPERNEVAWSAMISRYSQCGYTEESVKLFSQMVNSGFTPNISCFSSVINALATLEAMKAGMSVHARTLKTGITRNVFICSSLVDLYCKCGNIADARSVFETLEEKNVVCWNSMISGYSLNGHLDEARDLFDQMPKKNIASWNCMIAGYSENEQFDKVFEVFNVMLLSGEIPDPSSCASVLCACASIASLGTGKNLHGKIVKLGLQLNTFVGTALTDMYAKCGDIDSSRNIFDILPRKNEITWTAMIQGLAENGFAEESISLFEEMLRNSSVAPNELILSAVLFACSHCGLVDKGLCYFGLMKDVYNLEPKERHYTCVVDMLSRAGRLSEAERFIKSTPSETEVNAWAALLSGCKIHSEDEIAERAAKRIYELGEKKSGGYILLSNVYASAGRWTDVMHTRQLMKEKGLKKSGGCSWLELKNEIHIFYSQDGCHSQTAEIYGVLESLQSDMLIL
ncbi:hypothetical protein DCAR_0312712 [Daucus carota subsp. sativus]|uniref:Pentatricopeptide repeat-containing protein At2g13600-like n=2 Tax=Daucus carota subsp. sativus TaxID=79200 RepID=A0AAF0WRZ5_DAUCS|nr:PREDICTED: pentatricopeptide repeat-containing protein At5g42450, mitochondrial-like [Daucus carota subsp. sativus]WOG93428.1 hypothetical protein DCAR_0312712 [Daucus carota subsp. sativus]